MLDSLPYVWYTEDGFFSSCVPAWGVPVWVLQVRAGNFPGLSGIIRAEFGGPIPSQPTRGHRPFVKYKMIGTFLMIVTKAAIGTQIALFLSVVIATGGYASELVYTPFNPSFGGNPLNGSILSDQAEKQKRFKEPSSSLTSKTTLEQFQESLERQILNTIARNMTQNIVDSNGNVVPGTFEFGDFQLSVNNSDPSMFTIEIQELNGNSTTVEIPKF